MPPMVRMTELSIRHVPENPGGRLTFGANPRQLLIKVELPLTLPLTMAGLNQVVMMSLSMVVIAALISAGERRNRVWDYGGSGHRPVGENDRPRRSEDKSRQKKYQEGGPMCVTTPNQHGTHELSQ